MKKFLLLLYFITACAAVGFCQTSTPTSGGVFQKTAVLQKQLKLSSVQTYQLAGIFSESSTKLQKIIAGEHGDTDKILAAMAPLRKETIKKIILLLTPGQAIKFKQMVTELSSPDGDNWTPDRPRPIAP